ncbi:type III secretion inner membrane ring lipoprotein SctJ (plasmid) [Bosea vestrisii]|uniref:type III secretion system inner membrane ring lipoprotein SctJ n=1 Tax=Bosea vestrisii TaxID=151416 RepID=UPI0024DF7249|nr:type III secretion inner membrane ring lipoprotein SctJ [Bosea vestrisii]WID99709.1 type III secretion inner membrane ring lipoprotein SctJ [Bosea vestrisii]
MRNDGNRGPSRVSSRRRRIAVLIALAASLALGGCKADLYTKLQEREANEMLALLLNHGIEASRIAAKDGTSTIQVEQKQLAGAIDLLKAEGFPRQTFKNLGEVFKGSGLIASPTEERARYVYALSEELSRTISDIDGVLSARIHVVLPKNDLLRQDTTPSSASVFIRHDSRAQLNALMPQIKMLVANSIEGLSYDKVAVVFVPVERSNAAAEASAERLGAATGASQRMLGPVSMSWAAAGAGLAAAGAALGALLFGLLRGRRPEHRPRPPSRELTTVDNRLGIASGDIERKPTMREAA